MRVLVVEDEAILALDLAQTVREMGHEVAGPFATVTEALPECSATAIGFAIIDFNLKGETTEALARALRAEGVAFVLVTGSPVDALPPELRDAPILVKPLQPRDLASAIAAAADARS